MTATGTYQRPAAAGLLGGWISRLDLALELGLTVDTLRRWEGQRFGPPCVRAGRKVFYRRDGVRLAAIAGSAGSPARGWPSMNALLSHTLSSASGPGDWMQDRLIEARSVLADTTRHPDTLVILAARVVAGQTDCARECADAIDLLCLLDRRPLHAIAAAAFSNGGAA